MSIAFCILQSLPDTKMFSRESNKMQISFAKNVIHIVYQGNSLVSKAQRLL